MLIRGDALRLPLADRSVDLIVTSPPYFALRSYQDSCPTCGGRIGSSTRPNTDDPSTSTLYGTQPRFKEGMNSVPPDPDCSDCHGSGRGHYDGQIGSEPTPAAFLDALWAATAEMVRVLKPSGSLFVNLGDKYAGSGGHNNASIGGTGRGPSSYNKATNAPAKSLMGLPWRYAIGCIDQLGLILRAELIWSKPNGLPESVTDRVRRSHEQWFHLTREPRYYSAVDEIREPHIHPTNGAVFGGRKAVDAVDLAGGAERRMGHNTYDELNPLGKLPGSVWTVPSEPLRVPDWVGVDHFAAFPQEWPRRLILGWSPSGVCLECGEGRRPDTSIEYLSEGYDYHPHRGDETMQGRHRLTKRAGDGSLATITGYVCACPQPDAPTRPGRVLDPFCGTGTVPMVARALGRTGIGVDLSADYLRLARWRIANGSAKTVARTNLERQGSLL